MSNQQQKLIYLRGWRYTALVGGLIGLIGTAMYFTAVDPYINPNKWRSVQKITRRDIDQDEIQPGGMRVWSDPFRKRE
ncbi:small integral membrane protein 20-like [Tubulanus polymorphus]|uniref:small integral membrane protein 20-like n=1 Tax=Tubulanus polymorphus TaxID=672921 RepID=UPI003DA358FC